MTNKLDYKALWMKAMLKAEKQKTHVCRLQEDVRRLLGPNRVSWRKTMLNRKGSSCSVLRQTAKSK